MAAVPQQSSRSTSLSSVSATSHNNNNPSVASNSNSSNNSNSNSSNSSNSSSGISNPRASGQQATRATNSVDPVPATQPQPQPQPLPQQQKHHNHHQQTHNRNRDAISAAAESSQQPAIVPRSGSSLGHTHSSTSVAASALQRSSGIFALAAAAFDKTIAGIAEPRVRPRQSLNRLSVGPDSTLGNFHLANRPVPSAPSPAASASPAEASKQQYQQPPKDSKDSKDPPSQPYSHTDSTRPLPVLLHRNHNKMHQTSSRLLRMTDDDRPFTKDFQDLFSTLIVSLLPLSAHRVRLTKVEHTFVSEDAINNLGSLKFSQSNRMPDPKDPSRIVTTTTTTTFSMAKDMARGMCQRFVEARCIESADGKMQPVYSMRGTVWQLTPKGICILDRFCSRNGIQQRQVAELIGSSLSNLVILERDPATDKIVTDRGSIEVIFRRFMGINGPNVKNSVNAADSDSLTDYRDGLTGVKMANERRVGGKIFKDTFTGKAASDWLLDCSTTVERRETVAIAALFVEYELMEVVQPDRQYMQQYPGNNLFQPTKHAIYHATARGKDLINGASRGRVSESEAQQAARAGVISRDSNTQRLDKILNDPALRLLFRENLRETHCEENLSFYIDVDEFVRQCRHAIRAVQKSPNSTASMDGIKEIMAQAYGIYNAFLAPGSPCELNIDHQLRNNLATRMTKAVGQDVAMIETLHEVTALFEDAQNAVFKLMASDSVPKFLRSPKYEQTLKNYDFDSTGLGHHPQPSKRSVERSQSRSNRK